MQITFKAKLLQYFAFKNSQQGAIWLKLIFGAVVLSGSFMLFAPYLLSVSNSCGGKARQAEARNNVGAMSRAQQAYFLEYKTFAKSIKELQVGVKEQTENYTYSIKTDKNSTFQYAIARRKSVSNGWFDTRYINSYVAAVFIDPNQKDVEGYPVTVSVVCKNDVPGTVYPSPPIFKNGVALCGTGSQSLTR